MMKLGIVVYSWSGNTLAVANRLEEKLAETGHAVSLEQIPLAAERERGSRRGEFRLGELLDLSGYEGLVFGAAVEAFSLSPVMTTYLKRVQSLEDKRVACLVTQQFPYAWMGGNRAIRQMKKLCRARGATIVGSAVVHWATSRREASTAAAVERLSVLF